MLKPELTHFKILGDNRGSLIALESNKNIPFTIKRVYYIFGTKEDVRRGCHAHKKVEQVAICLSGACTFLLDDGQDQISHRLSSVDAGLYLAPTVWREMFDFTDNCVLLLLASELYDEHDYISNYEEYCKLAKEQLCQSSF